MTKVAIIGSVGVPACYGGFETLAHYLAVHLGEKCDLTVYCSSKSYSEQPTHFGKAKLKYIPLRANGVQSIPYDILSILDACRKNDVLLVLGVAGAVIFPVVKLLRNNKIIAHIDGLEWKRDKWKKYAKAYLRFAEKVAVRYGDDVITDNEAIRKYVEKWYKKRTHLIEYGGDHAQHNSLLDNYSQKYNVIKGGYAFSVCRIVPENNIKVILSAFSQTKIPLLFIGNWSDSNYGIMLKNTFGNYKNIRLIEPIYDQKELDALRSNCGIYIHGHSAGGTNPSLVEAMYLGLNIIAYDVIFNRYTMNDQGSFFKSKKELLKLLNSPDIRNANETGLGLKSIAEAKYRWAEITNAYFELFTRKET